MLLLQLGRGPQPLHVEFRHPVGKLVVEVLLLHPLLEQPYKILPRLLSGDELHLQELPDPRGRGGPTDPRSSDPTVGPGDGTRYDDQGPPDGTPGSGSLSDRRRGPEGGG